MNKQGGEYGCIETTILKKQGQGSTEDSCQLGQVPRRISFGGVPNGKLHAGPRFRIIDNSKHSKNTIFIYSFVYSFCLFFLYLPWDYLPTLYVHIHTHKGTYQHDSFYTIHRAGTALLLVPCCVYTGSELWNCHISGGKA